jgi:sugar lactone lactonase YvrE
MRVAVLPFEASAADQALAGCASCRADCGAGQIPAGAFHPDASNSDGVGETPEGYLELNRKEVSAAFAWIANSDEGTVSKIDTASGREVARYPSSRPFNGAACDRKNGECPSRTAVDGNGDVWVGNRAFNRQGSVTKIAHVACPDVNGDGAITTSHDANGDGKIDLASPVEFPGDADECVLFTVPVGGFNGVPRALALDAGGLEEIEGSAWVGLFNEGKVVKLRNSDGAVTAEVDLPHYRNDPSLGKLAPYGAAIDSRGRVWVVTPPPANAPAYGLAFVDAATGKASEFFEVPADLVPPGGAGPIACGDGGHVGTYGLAVDEKDRVWVGGWSCEAVFRFDADSRTWAVGQAKGSGLARGVAVEARDGAPSRVWVAFSSAPSRLAAFDAESLALLGTWDLAGTSGAIGAGLDAAGKVWAIHQRTNNASRFDPGTGKVLSTTAVGAGPYTYSDFTGYARRHFTAPRGNYRRTFVPCQDGSAASFLRLEWEGVTPVGTRLDFWIRVGDDLHTLAGAPRYGPFGQSADGTVSPVDLADAGVPDAPYALVEVALTSRTGASTPELRSMNLVWTCPGPVIQ